MNDTNRNPDDDKEKRFESDKPTLTSTEKPKASVSNSPPKVQNAAKPFLVITGVTVAAVAAIVWGISDDTSDDSVVDVERAAYATQEACVADWNDPADCQHIVEDEAVGAASDASLQAITATPDTASSASDASQPAAYTGGGHGAYHGGVWYGPYYTQSGVVYHSNGVQTTGGIPTTMHGSSTSLSVRSSALDSGPSAFERSPHAVSVSEGQAISRGGFTSGHGGESGGHGFGGSRGG